ncbi:hypothetical protein H0H87_006735 [Tephrocybe sp. NHM501043]|nr:hypothetical protein H0H87_006735 [Tephrocybe sp. NHM501043]
MARWPAGTLLGLCLALKEHRKLRSFCPWSPWLQLAAAYAAIDDWNSGFLRKSDFNEDAYEDIYRGHELFLNIILTKKPRAYHRLMADLYSEVWYESFLRAKVAKTDALSHFSHSQGGHSAQTVTNSAMAILDLAAMEE